jgi:hypothetical protein
MHIDIVGVVAVGRGAGVLIRDRALAFIQDPEHKWNENSS